MSKADDYAAAIIAAKTTAPAEWVGPESLLRASVNELGNCDMVLYGQKVTIPCNVMPSFASWISEMFV
jgi:hypothetical protein